MPLMVALNSRVLKIVVPFFRADPRGQKTDVVVVNGPADGRARLHVECAPADGRARLHVVYASADGRANLHVVKKFTRTKFTPKKKGNYYSEQPLKGLQLATICP